MALFERTNSGAPPGQSDQVEYVHRQQDAAPPGGPQPASANPFPPSVFFRFSDLGFGPSFGPNAECHPPPDWGGLSGPAAERARAAAVLDAAISAGEAIGLLLTDLRSGLAALLDDGPAPDALRAYCDAFWDTKRQIDGLASAARLQGLSLTGRPPDRLVLPLEAGPGADPPPEGAVDGVDLLSDGPVLALPPPPETATQVEPCLRHLTAALAALQPVLERFRAAAERLATQADFADTLAQKVAAGLAPSLPEGPEAEAARLQALQVQQGLALSLTGLADGPSLEILRAVAQRAAP